MRSEGIPGHTLLLCKSSAMRINGSLEYMLAVPGSWADPSIFERIDMSKDPHKSQLPLLASKYLLADSAYCLTTTCIPAYKAPAANLPENKNFNFWLPKSRDSKD
ncbi:hypothetical protein EC957_009875 [Mortierella hygrophila]|uniref:DDE Tnp4 domain-containing protein n=1 Tax=Mortierella hygrophila TaxID=979708 RepID=A0A9P6EWQ3_9FUNG|nr:hypothetical protein EC957_009875 [Mortierella hygrophila]